LDTGVAQIDPVIDVEPEKARPQSLVALNPNGFVPKLLVVRVDEVEVLLSLLTLTVSTIRQCCGSFIGSNIVHEARRSARGNGVVSALIGAFGMCSRYNAA
jgi:hypothetical protein